MQKTFYLIDLDCSKSYKTFCQLVSYSRLNDIHWYQEGGFSHFLNCGHLLYSCEKQKNIEFEFMLRKFNVNFVRLDFLEDTYSNLYLQNNNQKTECFIIPKDNQNLLVEEEFPQIVEGDNGSIVLNEHIIDYKDKIKIYIESKEQCSHSIPHAHIDYNNQRNVFSISLVDFRILAGNSKGAKGEKAIEILKKNIDKGRALWNEKSDSHSKFDIDQNNRLLNTYHFI